MKALCLVLTFGLALPDDPQATKSEVKTKEVKDQDALQGTWSAVALADRNGMFPAQAIAKAKFVFSGNTLTFDLGFDGGKTELSFRLDPPGEITFGVASEKGYPAIYRLKGDTLRICICGIDRVRPNRFAVDNGWVVLELKRDK